MHFINKWLGSTHPELSIFHTTENQTGKDHAVGTATTAQQHTIKQVQMRPRSHQPPGRLGELHQVLRQMTNSRSDLSTQLVLSEEQKLQVILAELREGMIQEYQGKPDTNIYKELIDLQIETNRLKEQYEMESFELKSEILTLENRVLDLELTREKAGFEQAELVEQLKIMEIKRQELSAAYNSLESNYQALAKQHELEVLRGKELSLELSILSKKKQPFAAWQEPSSSQDSQLSIITGITAELERIRSMVQGFTHQKLKIEDISDSEQDQKKMEKKEWPQPLVSQENILEEMEKKKLLQNTHQEKLEERMTELGKELQNAKQDIGDTRFKFAEQSMALTTSQKELQEMGMENSKLQQQLKMMNEEYRIRLLYYAKNMASFMDSTNMDHQGPQQTNAAESGAMKKLLDGMLNDMQASNRTREQQLAKVARNYKKRMDNLMQRHESLLNAYRVQREQIKAQGGPDMEPGPPEAYFIFGDIDLQSSPSQELNKLREDKARLEIQIQDLQAKNRSNKTSELNTSFARDAVVWDKIQKQLQEFTQNTQAKLEEERSHLWSRALVAEEQLSQLQEYVNKHLGRYKQEILRLRKLLGNESSQSAEATVSVNAQSQSTINH
ncbi:coiled-coil domain-containing protein 78 isoform X1 [Monodelphis domestica]|uniref:coiled-coil domain-containing protein 78 isoform X1 n=2 Tax=Monodelphis domestica TaxID=13616 RepID=UPI0007B40497|nr:coiled-coil domain-containing protein 78 isoform X1 [Monodelphis domestica]